MKFFDSLKFSRKNWFQNLVFYILLSLAFNDINRVWMKKVKIGADGFLQLALQLAGRKYYGHPGSFLKAKINSSIFSFCL